MSEEITLFKGWPKIGRASPFSVTITEKMDGTNACIIIEEGSLVGVQSRKRMITPEDDNFGFALWVKENTAELLSLGDGYHYGEWAGEGIQKNPHNLTGRSLFLFNTFRWNVGNPNKPDICEVVPILYEGILKEGTVAQVLAELIEESGSGVTPEGVVVYYHAFRKYTKHTIKEPTGKWRGVR